MVVMRGWISYVVDKSIFIGEAICEYECIR